MLVKFKTTNVYDVLIALSNSFGLFLIILALGYSIISVPRSMFESILTKKSVDVLM